MDNSTLFDSITSHLLNDEKPSIYLNSILNDLKNYPFTLLYKLKETEQSPKHHPEGSVWNHTMLVVDRAAIEREKSNDKKIFMWAALLHDIGKAKATRMKKGRIVSYDHDKIGKEEAKKFLEELGCSSEFVTKVSSLVRWHMQALFFEKKLPFMDVETMKKEVDINELALLCLSDRLGRGGIDEEREKESVVAFLQSVTKKNL